ncbi:hypothetical protein [Kiloniella sp. b19]|uniref:hypothetical protein n=1 Tax=Kiloniella sp. GXU_MW_B19 TaxID=3141326 RepID=UPI0031D3130C
MSHQEKLQNETLRKLAENVPELVGVRDLCTEINMPRSSDHSMKGILVAIVAVTAIFVFLRDFEHFRLKDHAFEEALKTLGILIILALFVERAQEVYIKAWRGLERATLERAKQQWIDIKGIGEAENVSATDLSYCTGQIRILTTAITIYRAKTRKIAFISGLVLGILISLVGPRVLEEILVNTPSGDPLQNELFNIVDVFITGGLIGGGSEALHQVMEKLRAPLINKNE